MEQDKQPKRVKVVNNGGHRTGTRRAAVKPHKRSEEVDIKKIITDYMSALRSGSVTQTYWGATVDKNARILQANFGLESSDEPYLILDVTSGKGQAGMILSTTGIHLSDGRGGKAATTWKDFAGTTVSYQNNTLFIGKSGISSRDGKVLLTLLQQIQGKLAK